MGRTWCLAVAVVLVGLSLPHRLAAQNLLTNPSFDIDASGWISPSGNARVSWVPGDGNPTGSGPGCLEVGDDLNNGAVATAFSSEIPVTSGATYQLSGYARVPSASNPGASASFFVQWLDAAQHHLEFSEFVGGASDVWTQFSTSVTAPTEAAFAVVRAGVDMPSTGTAESIARWDDLFFASAGCTDAIICLGSGNRFQIEVEWRDFDGDTGPGRLVPALISDRSAVVYFFKPSNWEMLIKVLNGCPENNHYWVFLAATTNVEFTLTVTDTLTLEQQVYFNPLGQAADAITDTSAFATCP